MPNVLLRALLALALPLVAACPAEPTERHAPPTAAAPDAGVEAPTTPVRAAPLPPGVKPADESCHGCHEGAAKRPAHAKLLAAHPLPESGCVACHGGDPSATTAEAAHAPPGPDELLRGSMQGARCAACHVPGSVPATDAVAKGALLYLELGCAACHVAGPLGTSRVGPSLDTAGYRGSAYLRQVTRDPATVNPRTLMPAFLHRFRDAAEEDAVVAFLLAQRGPSARRPGLEAKACASCHATRPASPLPPSHAAVAGGAGPHRCEYLSDRGAELACARCHPTPPAGDRCTFVELHRAACGACHAEAPRAQ